MSKRILFITFCTLLILSVSSSYYRFVVLEDYFLEASTDCDPEAESCFVSTCNPEIEECSGVIETDTWYYKIVSGVANSICDPSTDTECETVSCYDREEGDCEETLCTIENVGDYSDQEACAYFIFSDDSEDAGKLEETAFEEGVINGIEESGSTTIDNEQE